MRRATIKGVETKLQRSSARRRTRGATIKTTETEALQINGAQRQEKGDNKKSGNRRFTDQRPAG